MAIRIPYTAFRFEAPIEPPLREEWRQLRESDRVLFESELKSYLDAQVTIKEKPHFKEFGMCAGVGIVLICFGELLTRILPASVTWVGSFLQFMGGISLFTMFPLAFSVSSTLSSYRKCNADILRFRMKTRELAERSVNYEEFCELYRQNYRS